MTVSGSCINLTPRYREYYRYSSALLATENITSGNFVLRGIQWPINYPNCASIPENDIVLCQNATPLNNPGFYKNISLFLDCKDESGNSINITSLDTSFFKNPSTNNLSILADPGNGTFCELETVDDSGVTIQNISCEIVDNPDIGHCLNVEGSHAATFFTYLFLRVTQDISNNVMYSLNYGTAMHLAKEHNGDFSMVLAWNSLAGVLSPLIAGALIVDSNDPSGKN